MRNAFWSVSAGQAKIDRGYDDYVERRISDALRARESAEWETELASVTAKLSALERPAKLVRRSAWTAVADGVRRRCTGISALDSAGVNGSSSGHRLKMRTTRFWREHVTQPVTSSH